MRMAAEATPERSADPSRVLVAQPRGLDSGAVGRALQEEFEVLVSPVDTSDILAAVRLFEPAVIVLDGSQRAFAVIGVLRAIRQVRPDVRVVVVATHLSEEAVLQALCLDVTGLVIGPPTGDAVIDCVRQVRDGSLCLDQATLLRTVKFFGNRLATLREMTGVLTTRELEIVRLIGAGLTNKEIAVRLFVEEGTIKVHLHHVFYKLQIGDRKSLAAYARSKGLAPDDVPG